VFPKDILDKIDGDATSYDTNDKLIPGKSYNFRLCKYNGSTCTEYSNALQVTAPEDKP
jgi:hypothetical protein